jgi:hypothetical protein
MSKKLVLVTSLETPIEDNGLHTYGLNSIGTLLESDKLNGFFDEIILDGVVSKIETTKFGKFFALLGNKLADGGRVSISYVDIIEAAWALCRGITSVADFHKVVYGNNYENMTIIETDSLKKLLISSGYTIETMTRSDTRMVIIAQRDAK